MMSDATYLKIFVICNCQLAKRFENWCDLKSMRLAGNTTSNSVLNFEEVNRIFKKAIEKINLQ